MVEQSILRRPDGFSVTDVTGEVGATTTTSGIATEVMPRDLVDYFAIKGYTLLKVIGKGGMGITFLAKGRQGEEDVVAIKVVNPNPDLSQEISMRGRREGLINLIAGVDNTNIVKVYSYGAIEETKRSFVVMEYLPGGDLNQYINHSDIISLEQKVKRFIFPITKAMDKLERRGIYHHDLKPGNILLTSHHEPKIADFGLAVTNTLEEKVRKKGIIAGTIQYMSPQQLNGKNADQRSDIFSLGIIFYQLITGKHPYFSKNIKKLQDLKRIFTENRITPISTYANDINPALAKIIHRMLSVNIEKRYQSFNDVLKDLALYAKGLEPQIGLQPTIQESNLNSNAASPEKVRLWKEIRNCNDIINWELFGSVSNDKEGINFDSANSGYIRFRGRVYGETKRNVGRVSRSRVRVEYTIANVQCGLPNASIEFFLLGSFREKGIDYADDANFRRVPAYNFRITREYAVLERYGVEVTRKNIDSALFAKYKDGFKVVVEKVDDTLMLIIGENDVRLEERLTYAQPSLSRKWLGIRNSGGVSFTVKDISIKRERKPVPVNVWLDEGDYEKAEAILTLNNLDLEDSPFLQDILQYGDNLYKLGQIAMEKRIYNGENNSETYFSRIISLPKKVNPKKLNDDEKKWYPQLLTLVSFAQYQLLEVAYARQNFKLYKTRLDKILDAPDDTFDTGFFSGVDVLNHNFILDVRLDQITQIRDENLLEKLEDYSIKIADKISALKR